MEIATSPVSKLGSGGPLPEDWCLRGMEWTGRQVYGRGFWRTSTSGGGSNSEMDTLGEESHDLHSFADGAEDLARARKRRMAIAAGWLARCVPGLAFDSSATKGPRAAFVILNTLEAKLQKWANEDREGRAQKAASSAHKTSRYRIDRV